MASYQHQTQPPNEQEQPVIQRNVEREVADMVKLEQVVIDHSLDQVESSPTDEELAGECPPRWQGPPLMSVAQQ